MDTRKRFDEIVDDVLARDGDVELTQMMGMPALKRDGKLWVGFWKGEMVFKLTDGERHAEALALDGAHLFDPGERGRPMKEWVVVPEKHAKRWPQLTEQALR
ncbi:MAG TPA: hypothetical protein VE444_10580 [Gaiellaceae bacterium]|jgi:hypothetical protein|nr:hypothetical protein [Gaiellaceae bacterium]